MIENPKYNQKDNNGNYLILNNNNHNDNNNGSILNSTSKDVDIQQQELMDRHKKAKDKLSEMEHNLIRLLNSVKMDNLKKQQELDSIEKQKRELILRMEQFEKRQQNVLVSLTKESTNLREMITAEVNRSEQIDAFIKRSTQSSPNYYSNLQRQSLALPPQSNPTIRELHELQQQIHSIEHNLGELHKSARSKQSHLCNLIDESEVKIANLNKQREEKERTLLHKRESELLIQKLEKEKENLLNSSNNNNSIINFSDLIADIKKEYFKMNTSGDLEDILNSLNVNGSNINNPISLQNSPTISKFLKKTTLYESKGMSKSTSALPEVPINQLMGNSSNNSPSSGIRPQLERKKSEFMKLPQSPDISDHVTIQYPLTIIINSEVHYCMYSLELDNIMTLRQKIFNYIEKNASHLLLKLFASSSEDISLKTTSFTFFSNEPKVYLKYIPFFVEQINQSKDNSLNPVIYIVSHKEEETFNNQISQILENYFESIKTTNQESIYYRTKMINFLDSISKQKKKLDGDLKNYRTPMSSFIRVRSVTSPLPTTSFNRPTSPPLAPSILQQQIHTTSPTLLSRPLDISGSNGRVLESPNSPTLSPPSSPSPLSNSGGWKSCSPSNRGGRESPIMTGSNGMSPNTQQQTLGHPGTCTIRLFITENIIKTFQCHVQTSVGELIDSIYSKFSKFIQMSNGSNTTSSNNRNQNKSINELKSMFVFKIRGLEIYLINQSIPLSSIDFINTKSRRQKKIDLLLILRENVDQQITTNNYDYSELSKLHSRDSLEIELQDDSEPSGNNSNSNPIPSYQATKRIRIRVGGLKNFTTNGSIPAGLTAEKCKIYTSVQLYQCGYKIGDELVTPLLPLTTNPSWLHWVEGPSFSHIPSNAILCLQVKLQTSSRSSEDFLLGWVNFRVWNYQYRVNSGFHCLRTWDSKPADPTGTTSCNHTAGMQLSFEVEMCSPPIFFSTLPRNNSKDNNSANTDKDPIELSFNEMQILTTIIEKDPLADLTQDERELCWKYRHYCKYIAKSTTKVISSVPWNDPAAVQELYDLLSDWVPLEPVDTLELLSSKFLDREVRKFAIMTLRRMSDAELSLYLPQLVQALKHEPNHYSTLAKFLLRRVLLNRQQMGHCFFWHLKAEISNLNQETHQEWVERYSLILESFLRGSGPRLNEISKQYDLYVKIKGVAISVKNVPNTKRKDYLQTTLSNLKLASDFQLPINPEMRVRGIEVSLCKVKESKTMPLWLSFYNHDLLGDNILSIFKAGDDLRQDQLTLQMIDLMDRMWLSEGIDLQTISYKCIATGPYEGMIEIVGESITIAEIQKLSGGITAAFSETAIASWLKQMNPSEFEYQLAVENFVRSCAGCCVYTFILGIGDRHNDNIMITKSGHLFHIDFGRFLGNVQTWNGIKRERAPFVFPPSFAHIIGEHFKTFEELCGKAYNVIRRKAHVLLNLFLMMVSTGMPELNHRDDIKYLRDALALDLTQEQASTKFSEMIQESIKSKATGVNFAVHILANPN